MVPLTIPELLINALLFDIALGGVLFSSYKAFRYFRDPITEEREYESAHEEANVMDLIHNDLVQLEYQLNTGSTPILSSSLVPGKAPNYRHNLHCPTCGRFSRSLGADITSAVSCSKHGIQVRWKDMPIDWALPLPVLMTGNVTVTTFTQEMEIITLPITGPIGWIPEDEPFEFEPLGARL